MKTRKRSRKSRQTKQSSETVPSSIDTNDCKSFLLLHNQISPTAVKKSENKMKQHWTKSKVDQYIEEMQQPKIDQQLDIKSLERTEEDICRERNPATVGLRITKRNLLDGASSSTDEMYERMNIEPKRNQRSRLPKEISKERATVSTTGSIRDRETTSHISIAAGVNSSRYIAEMLTTLQQTLKICSEILQYVKNIEADSNSNSNSTQAELPYRRR